MSSNIYSRDFSSELVFKASRSGGKGGQNVNKVSTKVELCFHVQSSVLLTDEEKVLLHKKAAARINQDGELKIMCQVERSQLLNKEIAIQKFYVLLNKCFTPTKARRATKPTKGSIAKRLTQKRLMSVKKTARGSKGDAHDE